jgi:hypothetical protein
MSKSDELRYGSLGQTAVHICVDMQRMFAEGTEWKMPWLARVLPPPSGKDNFYPLHTGPEIRTGHWNVAATIMSGGDP